VVGETDVNVLEGGEKGGIGVGGRWKCVAVD